MLLLSFAGAGVARAATYDIVPFTGLNGTVSPAIAQTVTAGSNATFAITAATNYHVADVRVDGASVGAVTSYTFTNVTAGHTLVATFAPDAIVSWQLQQPLPTSDFLGAVTFTDAAHGWAAGGGFGAAKGSRAATSDPAPRGDGIAWGTPTCWSRPTAARPGRRAAACRWQMASASAAGAARVARTSVA